MKQIRIERGARVIWRTGGIDFCGKVTAVKKNRGEAYVLFGDDDRPTGGHWLKYTELELQHDKR